MNKYVLLLLFIIFNSFAFSQKGLLEIIIKDIDNNAGTINIAMYEEKEKDSFPKLIKNAFVVKNISIINKTAFIILSDIPYGYYAISVYHDKNSNGKLDRSAIGFPAEPWGVSQNRFIFGPPSFDDGKFVLNSKTKTVVINLKSFF